MRKKLMLSQQQGLGENVSNIVSRFDIGDLSITVVNELPEPMTFNAEVFGARVMRRFEIVCILSQWIWIGAARGRPSSCRKWWIHKVCLAPGSKAMDSDLVVDRVIWGCLDTHATMQP